MRQPTSLIAALALMMTRPSRYRMYRGLVPMQFEPLELRQARQDRELAAMIAHAEANIPYYRRLMAEANLRASDVQGAKDLATFPVLTKAIIRRNLDTFYRDDGAREAFRIGRTGGSTGEPLQYRMSNKDFDAGVALLQRGWGYGGYRLGDRMVILAGGSLTSRSPDLASRVKDLLANIRHLSSYGMTPEQMIRYAEFMSSWRPEFIRGYASSLFAFSRFALDRGISLPSSVRAVFSTSESLTPSARRVISQAFETDVFDTYGLNDGGVSAYECERHTGFHVDLERAVLEVVDEDDHPVVGQPGRILATSLWNRAMPLIRYDTGDIGLASAAPCPCGRTGPLLTTILGRQTDLLEVCGVTIGSPVLTVLMGTTTAEWYQIVQTDAASLTFRIVNPSARARELDEARITGSIRQHVGAGARVDFEYLDIPDDASSGDKHRVIVNQWQQPD